MLGGENRHEVALRSHSKLLAGIWLSRILDAPVKPHPNSSMPDLVTMVEMKALCRSVMAWIVVEKGSYCGGPLIADLETVESCRFLFYDFGHLTLRCIHDSSLNHLLAQISYATSFYTMHCLEHRKVNK